MNYYFVAFRAQKKRGDNHVMLGEFIMEFDASRYGAPPDLSSLATGVFNEAQHLAIGRVETAFSCPLSEIAINITSICKVAPRSWHHAS